MSLNPIKTTQDLTTNYISYLKTTFNLKNPELNKKFRKELNPDMFVKGPILESTPPFKHGNSPKDLINEGVLSKKFNMLDDNELPKDEREFPIDRKFWLHQEQAIRRIIESDKNIVVATGTGSGKTEAFLVPILNHLFRQKEKGELTPGVRALLLYPMNALANDQLKRMRKLLSDCPFITFGRYTGETEKETDKAVEKYKKINNSDPLPNELVSRKQMKEKPPHILLTNYAMLEYLLLRPADNVFFDGPASKFWKYVVVDEAHTYNGAKGIEMAMLLRRLKERVVSSEQGKLKCIATSATLGEGEENLKDVSNFAENLFGEDFGEQNVIQASRKPLLENTSDEFDNEPDPALYVEWNNMISESGRPQVKSLVESGEKHGISKEAIEKVETEAQNNYKRFLYYVLKDDKRLISLRKKLREEPRRFEDIETDLSKEQLVALINLAVKAKPNKESQSLLPARYHLFISAIEGAYFNILPEKNVYLERREKITTEEGKFPVFEMATCRQCGATYLVGKTETVTTESPFEKSVKRALEDEGYQIHSQIISGKYRIDLAIYDSKRKKYLLGIECDGASYHSSEEARENDEEKQSYLEDQGWQIIRIWSQDWKENQQKEINRVIERIEKIQNLTESSSSFPDAKRTGSKEILVQPSDDYFNDPGKLEYYLLLDEDTKPIPDNEDELVRLESGDSLKGEHYKLCGKCGAIDKENRVSAMCNCDESNYFDVIKVKTKEGKVHKCPGCGGTNPKGSMVWRFLLGKNAIASVLATSLYQKLPPKKTKTNSEENGEKNASNEWTSNTNDGRQVDHNDEGSRQLLAFSDSRQDAAFFAPYLNRTYSQILRRRLLLKVIDDKIDKIDENKWRAQDLVTPLKKEIKRFNLFPTKSPQEKENQAWKWILHELLGVDSKIGLEGLGCLGFSLVKPNGWRAPKPLIDKFGLSEEEVWTLYQVLLDSFRKDGAIQFPDNVFPTDEFFKPRNQEHFVRLNKSSKVKHIHGWNPPEKGAMNRRQDFLLRLADKLGVELNREESREILNNIWEKSLHHEGSSWEDYFSKTNLHREGTVFKIKPNFWKLRPTQAEDVQWYQCDKCKNLTLLNVRGVCPNYRCDGELKKCDPDEVLSNNHYRNLYFSVPPLPMEAKEHTAQLTNEAAADLQSQFKEGDVNVLSCSTTFELGVDVGELESVFMRNVPPSTANYVQRAGRAGRRTDSTAFALTFCQRKSHDQTHFNDPKRMVSGEIDPPHFDIRNKKIMKRHIFATALSRFWSKKEEYAETFGQTKSFFFRDKENVAELVRNYLENMSNGKSIKWGENGTELLRNYLKEKPESLLHSLKRIIPDNEHNKFDLESWAWTSDLLGENEGLLTNTENEIQNDVEQLLKARQDLLHTYKPAYYILGAVNTIMGRYLINYFSRKNIIPKYGFPVDVVELEALHHSEEAKRLNLDRDLKIALSEYAPSSQVVAGGKLWTSRYLKKLPKKEWPKFRYAICENCGMYQRVRADSNETLDYCNACGKSLNSSRKRGEFVIPEFGFITSNKGPEKPKEERPEKTYTTRTYYSGESDEGEGINLELKKNITLEAIPASHGKMAVINHAGGQGFWICHNCGYSILGNELDENPHDYEHETPWGEKCKGTLRKHHLGHEFETDILQIKLKNFSHVQNGFWLSMLYALLEGASEALNIDRDDLNGTLFPYNGDPTMPAIILFDDVPGGAGHVKRIAKNNVTMKRVLDAAYQIMSRCTCGDKDRDTSCYGCLRNYRNQFCHDKLSRGKVIDFLEEYFL